jgi:hypothetical protein
MKPLSLLFAAALLLSTAAAAQDRNGNQDPNAANYTFRPRNPTDKKHQVSPPERTRREATHSKDSRRDDGKGNRKNKPKDDRLSFVAPFRLTSSVLG